MRVVTIVAVSSTWLAFACPTYAATQQDWSECSGKEPAVAIQACSRILSDASASASDRADGYLFRAAAYLSQQNFDLAVADYTEAIRLTPRNTTGYAGRALALFHKGNRDQASADFSMINQLDSATAAQLSATDPDFKQISELASRSPAPFASTPAHQHLPRDAGLPKQVVEALETNPLFSQAPPVAVRTYTIDTTSQSNFNGQFGPSTISSTGKNQNTVEMLGGGLVRFESIANTVSKTTAPGKPATISHQVLRRAGTAIGNGLVELDTTMSFQNDGRAYGSGGKILRIEAMSGSMFPMKVNNHFSFTTTSKSTGNSPDENTAEVNCVISREFDAKSFHPDLTGKAFLGTCETYSVNKVNKSLNLTAKDKKIFIEELGYWVQADPVSPGEHIMKSNETTTAGDQTFKMSGTMALKSFKLQP